MKGSHSVAFVVPALNAEKTIGKCLSSIKGQRFENEELVIYPQIVVIDNNSTDGTAAVSKEFGVVVIPEPYRNRSMSRNAGSAFVKAEWVAFVDADTVIEETWALKMLTSALSARDVGAVDSSVECSSLWGPSVIEELRSVLKRGRFNLLQIRGKDFPMINSAACLYKKEALLSVGGFDPALNSYEDIDLSKRIFWNGWVLISNESARAFCYSDRSTFFGFLTRYFELGKYRFLYNFKWSSRGRVESLLYEVGSFFVEAHVTSRTILKFAPLRTRPILVLFHMIFLLSKFVGSCIMCVSRVGISRFNLESFRPALFYRGQSWGVVVYPAFFLLFNPFKNEFLAFKRECELSILLRFVRAGLASRKVSSFEN